jgi:hypothetical protein
LRLRLQRTLDRLRRWLKGEPDLPADLLANQMAPLHRGPEGRSGAAAVGEPDEERFTDAREWRRRKA